MTSYDRDIVITKSKVKDQETGKMTVQAKVERSHSKWNPNSFIPDVLQ